MYICHCFETEEQAEREFDRLANSGTDKYRRFMKTKTELSAIDFSENRHLFMGQVKYKTWCMGKTYKMDGKLYHGGFSLSEIRGD